MSEGREEIEGVEGDATTADGPVVFTMPDLAEGSLGLPDPAQRRISDDIDGIPVKLADGKEWLLPRVGLAPALRRLRDSIFDDWMIAGKVERSQVREAMFWLLGTNYTLTPGEAIALISDVEVSTIVEAVITALIPLNTDRHTYTDWAEGALWANGIDPATVPPESLPHVLAQLVGSGRAVPVDQYTDSGKGAAKRAALMGLAGAVAKGEV